MNNIAKPINENKTYHIYENVNGYTLRDTRKNVTAENLEEAIMIVESLGFKVIRKFSTELYKEIVVE